MRLPEGLSSRYRIERELPTRGNEADLFVVHPEDDGAAVVVKLYRASVHPKDEVQARIATLDGRYVIRQLEYGVSEGRSFEVIEYATAGSLADLLTEKVRFDDPMLRALVAQVAGGLGYLHGLDPPIVHRDVKPDNVLVRRRDPLELVLTDFGLASVLDGGSWRASTADRTIKYAAPEASAGQVSREMDWWSLGMMVAEAAGGRHPFAGVSEQAVAIHYSNRVAIPLDEVTDDRTRLLCLGLLAYDRKQRWGGVEVGRWLAGDESLRPPVEETPRHRTGAPFKFAGGSYGTVKELAGALAGNWTAAQRTVARADGLLAWLKDEVKEYEAWQWLSEITQEKAQLDAGLKVTLLLPMLDPTLAPMFEGEPLTRERLLAEVSAASEGTDRARAARLAQLWEHLPALAELSPEAAWLGELHGAVAQARTEAADLIKALGSDAPKVATDSWAFTRHVISFLTEPEQLEATRRRLDALLNRASKNEIGWLEILLVSQPLSVGAILIVTNLEAHLNTITRRTEAENINRIKVGKLISSQIDLRANGWSIKLKDEYKEIVKSIEFTQDGNYIVSGYFIGKIVIWDRCTGAEVRSFDLSGGGRQRFVTSVAVTPDGCYLLASINAEYNSVWLWDFKTGKYLRDLASQKGAIETIAITPDGCHLVTGARDNSVRLWDVSTGQQLRSFNEHTAVISSVKISADGHRLITASHDGTVRLWDIATGNNQSTFREYVEKSILCATDVGDQNIIAYITNEGSLCFADAKTRKIHSSGGNGYISFALASRDGRYVYFGGADNNLNRIDLVLNNGVTNFIGHTGKIKCASLTQDGRYIATGGVDGTVRLWDSATGSLIRTLFSISPGCSASFTGNGHIESLKGLPGDIVHLVRGAEILNVDAFLSDRGETWRRIPVPRHSPLAAAPIAPSRLPPIASTMSLISRIIRRLFK